MCMDDDGQYFNLAVALPLFNIDHEKKNLYLWLLF